MTDRLSLISIASEIRKMSFKTCAAVFCTILWTTVTSVPLRKQCMTVGDPCEPTVPCEPGTELSFPANCERFQLCIAPYEWVATDLECGAKKGPYNNETCTCSSSHECNSWECPESSPAPPVMPAPCFLGEMNLECQPGEIIPDRYYCSNFFACSTAGELISQQCPDTTPYFDISSTNDPPCSNNLARCDSIPFEQCVSDVIEKIPI